jgi:three-Cys-motif partner protein
MKAKTSIEDATDAEQNVAVVGNWAHDKVALLTEYIKISSAVRRKYVGRSEATYIDLFCGPGQSVDRDTGGVLPGSPIAAWTAALDSRVPFSRVFIADASVQHVTSAGARLRQLRAPVSSKVGPAHVTVDEVYRDLIPYGLHFALLDPFNLIDLPFSVIEKLAGLRHIDLMIHLSTGDLQRNLSTYSAEEHATLDSFAPDWRKVVDFNATPFAQRLAIVEHWFSLIHRLGLPHAPQMHRARNSKGTTMYWLVFASRAEIARRFWGAANAYITQPSLL